MFQKNEVLFGHDGTPGLIAFEVTGDTVTIFSRDGVTTRSQTVPFQPLLLMADDDGLCQRSDPGRFGTSLVPERLDGGHAQAGQICGP